jgi:hypothetical protein
MPKVIDVFEGKQQKSVVQNDDTNGAVKPPISEVIVGAGMLKTLERM